MSASLTSLFSPGPYSCGNAHAGSLLFLAVKLGACTNEIQHSCRTIVGMTDSILPVLLRFVLSASFIVVAGIALVRFSDQIAEATKLGRLFVGSLLLAGATSLPEFFVDLNAVRSNMPDLAVGDLFGSSIFNLFILAIADLMHKGTSSLFSKTSSRHALAGAMSISVTALAGLSILLEVKLGNISLGGIGPGTIAISIAFFLGIRMLFLEERLSISLNTEVSDGKEKPSLPKAITGYVISAVVIFFAAPHMAGSAGQIAEVTGLGKSFIGTTLVAFSTSLPELVSTITAVRAGAFDLALGNIFGSNTFNMILLAPLDAFYSGSLLGSVSPSHVITSFATILITSIAVMGQLYQVEKRRRLIEPDALAVITLVLGTLTTLYFLES